MQNGLQPFCCGLGEPFEQQVIQFATASVILLLSGRSRFIGSSTFTYAASYTSNLAWGDQFLIEAGHDSDKLPAHALKRSLEIRVLQCR